MTAKFKFGPNQRKWLRELETTKLKQGRSFLGNNSKGFCCLGIGARVLGGGRFGQRQELNVDEVADLGLRGSNGPAKITTYPSCTIMNDKQQMSFKEIAVQLRRFPRQYFKRSA